MTASGRPPQCAALGEAVADGRIVLHIGRNKAGSTFAHATQAAFAAAHPAAAARARRLAAEMGY